MSRRSIAIFTGTRADWGIMSPLAKALQARADCAVTVLATNTHYCEEYGFTVNEIIADGFTPERLPFDANIGGTGRVYEMGNLMGAAAEALHALKPDIALILGDRFEMLACATACLMCHVPVAHIGGGAVSYGAVDDSIRHAITKMSAIHFVETSGYKDRVTAMGEMPERVFVTGALGLTDFSSGDVMSGQELRQLANMDLDAKSLMVTFHPATLDSAPPEQRGRELLAALQKVMYDDPAVKILFTASNNDSGGEVLNRLWQDFVDANPGRTAFMPSLGHKGYIAALLTVGAVVGNSSSGLVEVPSAGICTVDIGCRQKGRTAGPSVIHADTPDEICAAITKALATPRGPKENPYYQPDSLQKMVEVLTTIPVDGLNLKTFYPL